MRAQDPITEWASRSAATGWRTNSGSRRSRISPSYLGAEEPEVTTTVTCVDKKRQWSQARNVRNSVAIRSTLHMLKPGKKPKPDATG